MKTPRKDMMLTLSFAAFCVILFFLPTGYENRLPQNSHLARGRVLEVDNSDLHQAMVVKTGNQVLTVKLLSGAYRGQQLNVVNQLTGKMEMDEVLVPGREILVEYALQDNRPVRGIARGNYRLRLEVGLVVGFVCVLVLVGGWTGVKAVLSFVFAALMLWKIMIPRFLQGDDPIIVALWVVAAMTAAVSFLVGGWSRKGWITFIGAFSGLLLTCGLAHLFTAKFHLHGAVRPYAEALIYSGFDQLNLSRIFVASIFVACSGAVMDLAMDISASMDEILKQKPDIGLVEHIRSGMAVGRSVVGTMTTTLLLAYSGSYIALLMLMMGLGVPLLSMLNRNIISAEILNTMVGSFGMVTVAPLTAVMGGVIYRYAHVGLLSRSLSRLSTRKAVPTTA